MRTNRTALRVVVVALAAVLLPSCTGRVLRADQSRVVIQTNPESPLTLVISRNFEVTQNDTGQQVPIVLSADTIPVSGPFDQTYRLDDDRPRILVKLINETELRESARVRVYLDGGLEYDADVELEPGAHVQYNYNASEWGGL